MNARHTPDEFARLVHEAIDGLVHQLTPGRRLADRALAEALADKLVGDLQALVARPAAAPKLEAAAWQWRRKGQPWRMEQTYLSPVFATTPDSEVRTLFAIAGATCPPAVEQAALETGEADAHELAASEISALAAQEEGAPS